MMYYHLAVSVFPLIVRGSIGGYDKNWTDLWKIKEKPLG